MSRHQDLALVLRHRLRRPAAALWSLERVGVRIDYADGITRITCVDTDGVAAADLVAAVKDWLGDPDIAAQVRAITKFRQGELQPGSSIM